MQPGNHVGSVKSVEVNSAPVPLAVAGDTVDVALNGIDTAAVSAGSMLCHPQWPVPVVARFEARVVVLDVAMPILKGRQVGAHAQLPTSSRRAVIRLQIGGECRWRYIMSHTA